jgi:hypothetical protein
MDATTGHCTAERADLRAQRSVMKGYLKQADDCLGIVDGWLHRRRRLPR